jgi:hypothetical protein
LPPASIRQSRHDRSWVWKYCPFTAPAIQLADTVHDLEGIEQGTGDGHAAKNPGAALPGAGGDMARTSFIGAGLVRGIVAALPAPFPIRTGGRRGFTRCGDSRGGAWSGFFAGRRSRSARWYLDEVLPD